MKWEEHGDFEAMSYLHMLQKTAKTIPSAIKHLLEDYTMSVPFGTSN